PLALISEAVRGEGATLLNALGERFMQKRHKLAELAPRDVVAREIFREQAAHGTVHLDARKLGQAFYTRFPGITALCRARGINPVKDLIPVTPAAHYMMGGVVTDLAGRSSLPRLYAVGEVARTGVHGANRLASNSLLEGLVFAERAARDLVQTPKRLPAPRTSRWEVPALDDRGAAQVAADEVRSLMWEHASIARTAPGLRKCIAQLDEIAPRLPIGATEERNLLETARLVAEAALLRKESRGGHFRSDFPKSRRKWQGRHITW
ncbi:MAG: FAD-binding protein, partial [Gemmatimonadota bacterium]|nr:FAD-binding protein [Gemmatimonadota bacterium]